MFPNGFPSSHTLQISSTGILYAEWPGLRVYDLSTPDSPMLLFEDDPTINQGHDSMPKGTDRLYDFQGREDTVIWDVSDPDNPFKLGTISDPEIIFDQGLGDLFVIRVAGNIVAPSQVGSVEFAAAQFGTRLVVVLGHSRCGAILATLDELRRASSNDSWNLRSIVDRIRPSVEALLATELRHDPEALVRDAVRANVRVSADQLRHGSELLERMIERDGMVVVGAEYSLETGEVDFFDGVPAE